MTDAAEEAKKDTETTAIQVYQYFCDICSWRLLTHDSLLRPSSLSPTLYVIGLSRSPTLCD